jgi:uncharacterized protein YbaR (Trm112 family)
MDFYCTNNDTGTSSLYCPNNNLNYKIKDIIKVPVYSLKHLKDKIYIAQIG